MNDMVNKENISQAEFERIEKYIMLKMTETEKTEFDNELRTDPELKAKFEELKYIIEGIEKVALKEELEQIHARSEAQDEKGFRKKSGLNRNYFSIAASVIIVALISTMLFLRPKENERLFADYFESDPGLVTAMSSNDIDYEFERGMVDYKSGEYKAAIDRWKPLLAENPANDTLNYFLGTAHLELNNTGLAIARLKEVTKEPQSRFFNEAHWYLALAYLLENKTEDAFKALEKTSHPSKKELLSKLDK